ncbi:hypothetical protein G6F62_013569 [Rhizopus arrhizus]|nr:hypothetical protein G6F62_013569 [Rhizopus arrhizus]
MSPSATTSWPLTVSPISAVMVLAIQFSTADPPKPTLAPEPPAATAPLTAMAEICAFSPGDKSSGLANVDSTTMSPAADKDERTAPAYTVSKIWLTAKAMPAATRPPTETDTLPASAAMLAMSRAAIRISPAVAVTDASRICACTVFWIVLTATEPLTATPAPPARPTDTL